MQGPDLQDPDLLNGWKAIGAFFGISSKQATRWERDDNLPVFHPEGPRGPVFARKSALRRWYQGRLQRVILEDDQLIALGTTDKTLWTHSFPGPLRRCRGEELGWRAQRADLRGDDDRGVIVTARFLNPGIVDTLYYFSSSGVLEWELAAETPLLDRNGSQFESAWAYQHVILAYGPKGPAIWAALANHAGWAGCVMRIDADGAAEVRFANTGWVERLCHVPGKDGGAIIVCGENNAFDQSFVALLGIDDPPSTSPPGGYPRYGFLNSPSGRPQKYILFPTTELIAARQKPYGGANQMRQYPGDIIVEAETGEDGGSFLYHFSPQLEPKYVFPSGSHEFCHRPRACRTDRSSVEFLS